MLVVAGAVPVQPIADVVRTSVIEAKALENPTITEQTSSLNLTYGQGGTLSITVSAEEGAELSYLWFSSDSSTGNFSPISGATSATYTIPTDQSVGTTYYKCSVTAEKGGEMSGVNSAAIPVTIQPVTKYAKIVTTKNNSGSTATVTESVELPKTYNLQQLTSTLVNWGYVKEVTSLTVSGANAQKIGDSISKDSVIQINDTGAFTITYSYKDYNDQTYSGASYTVNVTEVTTVDPTVTAPTATTETLTYNKYDRQLFATSGSVAEGQGTMYYAVTTSSTAPDANAENTWEDSIDKVKRTDAKTYYLWYKVKGNEGYNDVEPTPVGSVAINKATPEATINLAKALNQQIIQSKSVTGGTL